MIVHKYEVNFLDSNLNLFISYYKTKQTLRLIKKINSKQKVKLKSDFNLHFKIKTRRLKKRKKKLSKFKTRHIRYKKLTSQLLGQLALKKKKIDFRLQKRLFWILLNRQLKTVKKKRSEFLEFYKRCFNFFLFKTRRAISSSSFVKNFLEGLILYTKKSFTVRLILQQLNTKISFPKIQSKKLKRLLGGLRRFKRTDFFAEGVNVLFNSFRQKNSAFLIANFIATQLKYMKRHNFFFKFLKSTFNLLIKRRFSKIEGIKVLIKGRLNNSARSRSKVIALGRGIPITTINTNIDQSKATSYHYNGTIGVTV
jgi:hypothetical protein